MANFLTWMQTELWAVLFINHTAMLTLSIIIMLAVSKGKLSRFGFKLSEDVQRIQVISLGLCLGIISTFIETSLSGENSGILEEMSTLQIILFIWIYASISEEVFFRGLIQSSLSRLTNYGFKLLKWRISLPVLISSLLFGLMHLMQSAMGAQGYQVLITVTFAFALGIVAAYQREKTGSLVPAILVHMFANIGGSLAGVLLG